MPTIKRIQSGRKAKKTGDVFERILKTSAEIRKWKVTKHPSGCKRIWTPKGIITKDVPTEYDFTFVRSGEAIFADAKSTVAHTYTFSMITPHQIEALFEYEREGFKAGYIVNFSDLNKTVFFSAGQLHALKSGSGLKPEAGIHLGDNAFVDIDMITKWIDV